MIIDHSEYFSRKELQCHCGCGQCLMDSDFMNDIDWIREAVGQPLGVNSGYRCKAYDATLNNDDNHPRGLAIDLAAPTDQLKWKIFIAALSRHFNRFGFAKTFIHLDKVLVHPPEVIWIY